jgi:hypothetical protein
MENRFHIISASGFALICLLFFLPFINVKCAGQEITQATGMELVTGFSLDTPSFGMGKAKTEESSPDAYAIITLCAGIAGIVFSLAMRGHKNQKPFIISASGLAAFSLIALNFELNSRISSKAKEIAAITVNFQFAYWLALLAAIALFVFGIIYKPAEEFHIPDHPPGDGFTI